MANAFETFFNSSQGPDESPHAFKEKMDTAIEQLQTVARTKLTGEIDEKKWESAKQVNKIAMKKEAFQKLAGYVSLTQANKIKYGELIDNMQDLCGGNKTSHSYPITVKAAHETLKNH